MREGARGGAMAEGSRRAVKRYPARTCLAWALSILRGQILPARCVLNQARTVPELAP